MGKAKTNATPPAAVAITMDDFTLGQTWPQTPSQVSRSLLDLFEKHRLRITLFVKAANVDNPTGRALLQDWADAGHVIGNHTYSHQTINAPNRTLHDFESDLLRAEQILRPFSTYERIFRFPALKEGNTVEVRDGMRAFLQQHGYRSGRVTIDASDWYYAERLRTRLHAEPNFDPAHFLAPYVQHIQYRSRYYDDLARKVLGRTPKHTLLVHYSFLNAQFLGNILDMYGGMNWNLINASDAFTDPVFSADPTTLPAGESLIWALARQTGRYEGSLRYPGEDDTYEKPRLDGLGL